MTGVQWEFLGAELLERERRPVLVLNRDHRIIRANRALLQLLEPGALEDEVNFVDDWVLPEVRETFLHHWERVLKGERLRAGVLLRPTISQCEPVFELVPLSSAAAVHGVMLVLVHAQPAAGPAAPLSPPEGLLYEVSIDDEGRPDRLLRAQGAAPLSIDPSSACYRNLHGRDLPCDTCAVRDLGPNGVRTVVRVDSNAPFRASLMSARRRNEARAVVSSVPVDEKAYGALVLSRVEAASAKAKLTTRERQVLDLLMLGRTLEDISVAHGISVRTAKYHQQNLLRKLGAESRMDLFRLLS